MIYECTDCKHCANFDFGFRIYCLHPDLPTEEVFEFEPLGDEDADYCKGFEEEEPQYYSYKDIFKCEEYCVSKYNDITYEGIREWCLNNKIRRNY